MTYKDKDDGQKKTLRRIDRYSAESDAVRLSEEGHADVEVRDTRGERAAGRNTVAVLLAWAGFALIALGIVAGIATASGIGDWRAAWPIWLIAALAGLLFIGFAEAIRLLDRICRKLADGRPGERAPRGDGSGQ